MRYIITAIALIIWSVFAMLFQLLFRCAVIVIGFALAYLIWDILFGG